MSARRHPRISMSDDSRKTNLRMVSVACVVQIDLDASGDWSCWFSFLRLLLVRLDCQICLSFAPPLHASATLRAMRVHGRMPLPLRARISARSSGVIACGDASEPPSFPPTRETRWQVIAEVSRENTFPSSRERLLLRAGGALQ